MAFGIFHKRGLKRDLPTLRDGELGFTQDEKDLYIGSASGNVLVGGESVHAQLADIAKFKTFQEKQNFLFANFYRKLRKGTNVKIVCMGDSLTYGHDTVSGDVRTAPTDPLPNGTYHSFTRASKTYPEALAEFLDGIYTNTITVENRGYSGDGTKLAYERWITSANSDLSIICLGVNDSRSTAISYYGNIEEYLLWYRKLIERELNWNSAVVIMTPPKMVSATEMDVDTFSNALQMLGQEYGIPVIEADEMLANYGASIYAGGTHLNGTGYTIWAAKIASLFVGEGCHKPKHVSHGSKLLARPTLDNVLAFGGSSFTSASVDGTPDEVTADNGIYMTLPSAGAGAVYSFYCDTDDLVVAIDMKRYGKYKLELDFGVSQPQYSLDNALYKTNDTSKPLSIVEFTDEITENVSTATMSLSYPKEWIHIATKGWHTLKITSVTNNIALMGLDFIDYKVQRNKEDIGAYNLLTHATYQSGAVDVPTTVISYAELKAKLKLRTVGLYPYLGTALKITVCNYQQSILEYVLQIGRDTGTAWYFVGLYKRTDLVTPVTAERTISNIAYDSTTGNITITWAGSTARESNFTIQLL